MSQSYTEVNLSEDIPSVDLCVTSCVSGIEERAKERAIPGCGDSPLHAMIFWKSDCLLEVSSVGPCVKMALRVQVHRDGVRRVLNRRCRENEAHRTG